MTSLNSVQCSAIMCIPFHLVVRADYSYFLSGKGEGQRDEGTFADLRSFCKNLPPKKIVAEFNIDFDYPYQNPEREGTLRLFLSKHVRPATLKTTLSELSLG